MSWRCGNYGHRPGCLNQQKLILPGETKAGPLSQLCVAGSSPWRGANPSLRLPVSLCLSLLFRLSWGHSLDSGPTLIQDDLILSSLP